MLLPCSSVSSTSRSLGFWVLARAIRSAHGLPTPILVAPREPESAATAATAATARQLTNEAPLPDGALQSTPRGPAETFHLGTIRPPTPPTPRFLMIVPGLEAPPWPRLGERKKTRERCPRVGLEPIGWSVVGGICSPVIGCPSQHQSMTHLPHVPALWATLHQNRPAPTAWWVNAQPISNQASSMFSIITPHNRPYFPYKFHGWSA